MFVILSYIFTNNYKVSPVLYIDVTIDSHFPSPSECKWQYFHQSTAHARQFLCFIYTYIIRSSNRYSLNVDFYLSVLLEATKTESCWQPRSPSLSVSATPTSSWRIWSFRQLFIAFQNTKIKCLLSAWDILKDLRDISVSHFTQRGVKICLKHSTLGGGG